MNSQAQSIPDYLDLFKQHIPGFRRTGSCTEWVGLCPFPTCSAKSSPKFYANMHTGQYNCKRCGVKGNAITFARNFGENPIPFFDKPGR